MNRVTPGVKVLGVTPGEWGTPMRGSKEDIQGGRYPYDRFVYVYVRRLPGQPVDPFVKEYLRMALSKEGQDAIACRLQAVAADPAAAIDGRERPRPVLEDRDLPRAGSAPQPPRPHGR